MKKENIKVAEISGAKFRAFLLEKLSNPLFGYFKYVYHICNAYHLRQARRLAIFAAGIFCAFGFRYSSVPCGALMRPQPVSGGKQRGAELFLFPSRLIIKLLFHLNCLPK